MRGRRGSIRRSGPRLLGAAALAILVAATTVAVSSAAPTQKDLDAAKSDLVSLNQQLSQLVERYDQVQLSLNKAEGELADAKAAAQDADALVARARAYFSMRAAEAYEGAGSEIEAVLGSTSFADFTARIEFLNSLAQDDVDAANQAQMAGVKARVASARLADAVRQRQDLLHQLDASKTDIQNGIARQQALIDELQKALTRQALQKLMDQPAPNKDPGPGPSPSPPPPPPPPPPPSGGAQVAVQAALSVIGTPYVWGGSDPNVGFDCSGLTMWAWGQAGVSLPHSSLAQYGVTPRVSRGDLQPGDLLFFYHPISHVAMYIGNNQMVHATHPGSDVHVDTIAAYWWAVYVGAGRP